MENRRIIFVGMHNKPGKTPLCSSTKSGKLVDRIAEGFTHIKTNLYDVDYFPDRCDKYDMGQDWIQRVSIELGDIVVLLGREVHENFPLTKRVVPIIKIPHPSSQWSHEEMKSYVENAREKIKSLTNKQ